MARKGGRYGKGYVYASRPVNPQDWFYPFHFYQDPVMPGSLGVEAILEAMQVLPWQMTWARPAVAALWHGGRRTPPCCGVTAGRSPNSIS